MENLSTLLKLLPDMIWSEMGYGLQTLPTANGAAGEAEYAWLGVGAHAMWSSCKLLCDSKE